MSIHSSIRRNEIQTSSAVARHGTPNHLARLHCGYNIYLVQQQKNAYSVGAIPVQMSCLSSGAQCLPLIGVKERHEARAAVELVSAPL